MIREINVSEITAAIKEMCIQANHFLSPDMDKALKAATANEESPLGKKILNQHSSYEWNTPIAEQRLRRLSDLCHPGYNS